MNPQPQPVKGLEPCPFCGTTADLEHDGYAQAVSPWGRILCHRCDVRGPVVENANRDCAIEAWNARAISSAISEREGLVRSLVYALKIACGRAGMTKHAEDVLAEARKVGIE